MDTVEGCPACLRLARAYESETMTWFRLEGHLRIAEYSRDAAAVEKIAKELDGVTRKRTELRREIEQHRSTCHLNGSPKTKTVSSS